MFVHEASSLVDWLKEPWGTGLPFDFKPPAIPAEPTNLQVYAALIAMGGRPGGGYGIISGGGLYGQVGLHQDEAFVYWQLESYVQGWLVAFKGQEADAVRGLLQEEWDRVKALTGVGALNETGDGQPGN